MTDEPAPVGTGQATEWGQRAATYAAYAVPKNRPYARRLVALVAPSGGERVLDVATGPGVVAVEAALAMGGAGEVLATDLAPEWEPFVVGAAREAGLSNVRFRVMPAQALDLPDETFDIAFCQFGLMFVPDPASALAEMERVVRPGGRIGIAVWSTPDKVAHFAGQRALVSALPPAPAPDGPSPMSLGEPGLIERMVGEAGFLDLVVERPTLAWEVADPDDEWRRLADDPRFSDRLRSLPERELDAIRGRVRNVLEAYREADAIRLPSEAIVVVATRP